MVVALRKTLLLSLDDLLVVTREFIHPEVSRSGPDRRLRRHGVADLKALLPKEEGPQTPVKTFETGFWQVSESGGWVSCPVSLECAGKALPLIGTKRCTLLLLCLPGTVGTTFHP